MKNRIICGCRTSSIVLAVAVLKIFIFLYLITVSSRHLNDVFIFASITPSKSISTVIEPAIKLAVAFSGLMFALLLFDGIRRNKPILLQIWMVWAVIPLFFIVFRLCLCTMEVNHLGSIPYVLLLVFQIFSIVIVRIHSMSPARMECKNQYTIVDSNECDGVLEKC